MTTSIKSNEPKIPIDVLLEILSGIDKTETESKDGWWETSAGARFGAEIIAKIKEAAV